MPSFTILTVCTGNICRSPLAAQLLQGALPDLPVKVHSAGTMALEGHQMPEQSQHIASDLGVPDPDTHTASQLTLQDVESADLILAMAREHRSAVATLSPRALRKVFTVRELARVSASVPDSDLDLSDEHTLVERLRNAIEAAAINRGMAEPADTPIDDDVIDPYRRSDETYAQSRDELVAALNAVTSYLRRVTT